MVKKSVIKKGYYHYLVAISKTDSNTKWSLEEECAFFNAIFFDRSRTERDYCKLKDKVDRVPSSS